MNALTDVVAEPLLKLSGITKRYGRVVALSQLQLDVDAGSFTCLVGPSGCGKTTLLRIICGLESADEGTVVCAGHDVSHKQASARHMGLVFQSYALFPNLSVSRNVSYGLPRDLGRRATAHKVQSLLETVGLSGFERRKPHELSGGQQQRVAIARALAPQPSVLLLDEPLSALDAQLRIQVRTELQTLQRRLGITTIMVTHDQTEALAIADRIAVMHHGCVVQVGAPLELYCRPADRFVAGFLGRMSFLAARVEEPGVVRLATGQPIRLDTAGYSTGAAVELGIRPEDVTFSQGEANACVELHVRVFRREFLGATMRLDAVEPGGGAALTLDLPLRHAGTISDQSDISVFLPVSRLHLFAAGQA